MIEELSKNFDAHCERNAKVTKTDGHSLVAQSLKSLGVTHVYYIAGTPTGKRSQNAPRSAYVPSVCAINSPAY